MVKVTGSVILALLAIGAQLAVFALLIPAVSGEAVFLPALLTWQLLAAVMAALFFAHSVAGVSRQYRCGLFFHVFSLCLFLPVGGQLLSLGMTLAPVLFRSRSGHGEIEHIQRPEFLPSLVSRMSYGAASRLKRKLGSQAVFDRDRLAAMIAMRSLPLHYTGGMLSDLLSDPQEEIRLLAYGISNAAESGITQKIRTASQALNQAQSHDEEGRLRSELAELHWELVYQNMVQGELWQHALERVESHAHAALALDESNAAMWCLMGRCALARHEPLQAEFFLLNAGKRKFPGIRLLPWLAEAAFMKGEHERIGPMLGSLLGGPLPPVLQPVVRYWTK